MPMNATKAMFQSKKTGSITRDKVNNSDEIIPKYSPPTSSSFDSSGSFSDSDTEIIDTVHSVEVRLMRLFDDARNDDPTTTTTTTTEEEEDKGPISCSSGRKSPPSNRIVAFPPVLSPHAYPCSDTHKSTPTRPPSEWPQRPLLLRPTPKTNTKIRGIRYSSERTYLALPDTGYCAGCTLPINNGTELPGKCLVVDFETDLFIGTAMLRIKDAKPAFSTGTTDNANNDNNNHNHQSYFHGKNRTFQAIVRGKFLKPNIPMSECVTGQMFTRPAGKLPPRWILHGAVKIISHLAPQLQAKFDGHEPKFLSPLVSTAQSVVGKKHMSDDDDDENGELTLLNGVLNTHHAHDDVEKRKRKEALRDRINKYQIYKGATSTIEDGIEEPPSAHPTSLLQDLYRTQSVHNIHLPSQSTTTTTTTSEPTSTTTAASIKQRMKLRKRTHDKLFALHSPKPAFDCLTTEYTFEFYQHLLYFGPDELCLDLGGPLLGKHHRLSGMLNGQPLKFMAAHQQFRKTGRRSDDDDDGGGKEEKEEDVKEEKEEMRWLWSFDIWHESLYARAMEQQEEEAAAAAAAEKPSSPPLPP